MKAAIEGTKKQGFDLKLTIYMKEIIAKDNAISEGGGGD